MTVKELIVALLECDMNKEVTIEYPNGDGQIIGIGNYSRYNNCDNFNVTEYMHGVVFGIENEN